MIGLDYVTRPIIRQSDDFDANIGTYVLLLSLAIESSTLCFSQKVLHYHKVGKILALESSPLDETISSENLPAEQNQSLKYYLSSLSWQLIRKELISVVYILLVGYCTGTYMI